MDYEKLYDSLLETAEKIMVLRGGPTSGNWAHDGRPGRRGGSGRGGGFGRIGVGREAGRKGIKRASRQTRVKDERQKGGATSGGGDNKAVAQARETMTKSLARRNKELAEITPLENKARALEREFDEQMKKKPKTDKAFKARETALEKIRREHEATKKQLQGKKSSDKIIEEHIDRTKDVSNIIFQDNLKKAKLARVEIEKVSKRVNNERQDLEKQKSELSNKHKDLLRQFNESGGDRVVADQMKRVGQDISSVNKRLSNLEDEINKASMPYIRVDTPAALSISSDTKSRRPGKWSTDKSKDWQDYFEDINSITSQDVVIPGHKIHVNTSRGRANASWGGNQINVNNDENRSVVSHEIAHTIEMKNPRILNRAIGWRDGRTKGEQYRTMNSITGQRVYGKDEISKPDKFIHPYVGKSYGSMATEVISVGVEHMLRNPAKLAKDDPDMFDFVYAVLRSG